MDFKKYEGHTPGPWHLGLRQAEKIIYTDDGWAVANATVYHGEHDAEVKPNALLIADAPALLERCKRLESALRDIQGYQTKWCGEKLERLTANTVFQALADD